MGRVSKEQALQNREQVVTAAARLFRERGVQDVSVADVMAAAGLTHGGFYRRFASKEALVAEAVGHAFADRAGLLEGLDARGDHNAARHDFVEMYLSAEHRDSPGDGCPAAGFCGDLAREDAGDDARAAYAEGIEAYGRWMADGGPEEDLASVATLIGAMVLARATNGTPVSDRIMAAARESLQRRR
jgi:TetR/AcrR family transcriptional regulator, transcriptional repressor for nem operon